MTTRKSPRSAVEPMRDLPDDIRMPRPLADRLRRPVEGASAASISIQELLCLLEPDAHLLLLMLVCTPFLLPLPSMGLSSPAGIKSALLSLPLPIPFSNAVPTVSIMLLCVGVVFGDGLVVLAGHLVCGVTCGIFGLMGGMLWQMVLRAIAWVV